MSRKIGSYEGNERGPLIICFGAMHGNEPAGVKAIDLVLKLLDVEPIKNPEFNYKGKFVGLIGNLKAYHEGKRFIKKDLNRQFKEDQITGILSQDKSELSDEDEEIYELINIINKEIEEYKPSQLVVLDLHTTSSMGGIFSICQDEDRVIKIAKALHAPVVLGMLEGLQGTTLHYFKKENTGVDTVVLTFESGQHEEPLSVNRAIAGILCCMRELEVVEESDVENYHEERLIEHTKSLPKLTSLIDKYPIRNNADFSMLPGFENFQKIKIGQKLAKNNNKDILAKVEGRILMPLYQNQGEDGFFIVKEI